MGAGNAATLRQLAESKPGQANKLVDHVCRTEVDSEKASDAAGRTLTTRR